MSAISTASGIVSVSIRSTNIALPISIAFGSISIGTGFLGVVLNFMLNKKYRIKEEKRTDIYILRESKLHTIESIVSKLNDCKITDEEFN
ncbi:MAG: hypothetical protein ACWIPI_09700 [Polaribacter sp.]